MNIALASIAADPKLWNQLEVATLRKFVASVGELPDIFGTEDEDRDDGDIFEDMNIALASIVVDPKLWNQLEVATLRTFVASVRDFPHIFGTEDEDRDDVLASIAADIERLNDKIDRILADPILWLRPQNATLRKFIFQVNSAPNIYKNEFIVRPPMIKNDDDDEDEDKEEDDDDEGGEDDEDDDDDEEEDDDEYEDGDEDDEDNDDNDENEDEDGEADDDEA
jgi:nucleosome binding factor SPN SPT16 subunit